MFSIHCFRMFLSKGSFSRRWLGIFLLQIRIFFHHFDFSLIINSLKTSHYTLFTSSFVIIYPIIEN